MIGNGERGSEGKGIRKKRKRCAWDDVENDNGEEQERGDDEPNIEGDMLVEELCGLDDFSGTGEMRM